jgi:hypothetical protein
VLRVSANGEGFWQAVCAIAEDDVSRAVFVEVLDSCRLTPDERRMILEKLAAARGDRQ